jgi:zinc finger CCHC domain-containing protein 9
MTRITDFGRKRTHVQAGFPDDSEPAQEPTEPHASTSTLPSESQPHDQVPPKKKRKRTKKPKENGDESGEKAGPSEDKAQDTVNSEAAKVVPKKKLKDKRKPKSRSFAVNNLLIY